MSNSKFQWKSDNSHWLDYSSDVNAIIMAAWSRRDPTVEFQIPERGDYIINFSEMRQIQKSNDHRWRRVRLHHPTENVASKNASTTLSSSSNTKPTQSATGSSTLADIVIGTCPSKAVITHTLRVTHYLPFPQSIVRLLELGAD